MSVDLRIFGIRRLRDAEIAELTGKTIGEIHESAFFRTLFPSAPENSGYRFFSEYKHCMESIRHMTRPVVTADDDAEYGESSYIYWEEELGCYWRNLSHDDPVIDEILQAVRGYMHYDQNYSVVPDELVGEYLNKCLPTSPEDEILAISYG